MQWYSSALTSSGGLYVAGDANVVGYTEAASFKVGGNQVVGSRKTAVGTAATDAATDAPTDANTGLVTTDFDGGDTVSLTDLVSYFNIVDGRLNTIASKLNALAGKYNTAAGYHNDLRDRFKVTGGHGLIAD